MVPAYLNPQEMNVVVLMIFIGCNIGTPDIRLKSSVLLLGIGECRLVARDWRGVLSRCYGLCKGI